MESLLDIKNLRTHFSLREGTLKAVDGVSLSIEQGSTVGLIGESGCGKSVTAQSVLLIVPPPGKIVGGSIHFCTNSQPVDLAKLDPSGKQIRGIRGKDISMIFQEPMTSLSPVYTVGSQICESLLLHVTDDAKQAAERAVELLSKVGISNPEQRAGEYPHQLSGGMRQRVMIAMALSCNPRLLIADEPTTALDVTVQAQILELMHQLREEFKMSMLYITHDLGVIAEIADTVNVMYLGKIIESASTRELFERPLHPYTQALLRSIPRVDVKTRSKLEAIEGTVPIPLNRSAECGFHERCPKAMSGTCDKLIPALVEVSAGHSVRCFLHSDGKEEQE